MGKIIIKDGECYCSKCGNILSINFDIRGSMNADLRIEDGQILLDEPDFNYEYSEATSDNFYCNSCGEEYDQCHKLWDEGLDIE